LFPNIWFNEETCRNGLSALGWYHEKRDEARAMGLGPDHDWCFARGTLVLTDKGWCGIEDISVHDQVLTPCGKRKILRSGIVRMADKWMFVNGIRCTPEHRFFTNRGLVMAANLRSTELFWTRDDWGLRILGWLCAMLHLGFMDVITSATHVEKAVDVPCSYIGWCMRRFMVKSLQIMKSITRMMTHTITTLTTLRHCLSSSTEASINPSQDTSVFAGYAESHSGVTRSSGSDVAKYVSEQIMPVSSANAEPAYSLTVERDHCYFVMGDNVDGSGRAVSYLVANSSHGADAFGLMCVAHEIPRGKSKPIVYPKSWVI